MNTHNDHEAKSAQDIRNAVQLMAAAHVAGYDASACPEDQEASADALIQRVIEILTPQGAILVHKHQIAEIKAIIGDVE